ncbi:RHS repeat-associated core domain-containing protein [Pseudomonas sp. CAM1A]|uniref:RHS repeat-associated core domain-containing protein n=1 Tax=Pseudomonas sp. CAM1A TaxID=3231717 RepID=UPI0039C65D43
MFVYILAIDWANSVMQAQSIPNAYTPYGSKVHKGGVRTGFSGQIPDPYTGHYHLGNGHRVLNPNLMRFISPDPLSPFGEGGSNSYTYCAGDPINKHDPTGDFFNFIKEMHQQFTTSFLRNSVPDAIPGRVMATAEAQQIVYAPNKSFFGERVAGAYIAKDSNGAPPLPRYLQTRYAETVLRANRGETPNVVAHLEMANTWLKFNGAPEAVAAKITPGTIATAVVGHLLGAATAGGADIAALKTGKALNLSSIVEEARE